MLTQARIMHTIDIPRVDEQTIKESMIADGAPPRDIADALAELKARKISQKNPGALVIGADQVLDHRGTLLSKPTDPSEAMAQLTALSGDRHQLLSAAVICEDGKPVWRHVGQVRVMMRTLSDGFLRDYLDRNWDSIRHSVGGYKIEEEGVRLLSGIEGDYYSVLGMPLLHIQSFLALRGVIEA